MTSDAFLMAIVSTPTTMIPISISDSSSITSIPTTTANFHSYAQVRPATLPEYNLAFDPFKCSSAPNKLAPITETRAPPPFNESIVGSVNSNFGSRCSSVDSNNQSDQIYNLVSSLPLEPVQQRKEWHSTVKVDLRYHLIVKLFKAIYRSNDLPADDIRIRDVLNFARKVEREFFEQANVEKT
uniref:KIX domain-containing protein n=1 Tax=Acrobeloides nanus TaxID=290746 RepID=A0A914CUF2_9BILA